MTCFLSCASGSTTGSADPAADAQLERRGDGHVAGIEQGMESLRSRISFSSGCGSLLVELAEEERARFEHHRQPPRARLSDVDLRQLKPGCQKAEPIVVCDPDSRAHKADGKPPVSTAFTDSGRANDSRGRWVRLPIPVVRWG